MAVYQTNVCTAGECGGECYRCRLKAVTEERDFYRRMLYQLLDRAHAGGWFGPWSDDWTEEWQEIADRLADAQFTGAI